MILQQQRERPVGCSCCRILTWNINGLCSAHQPPAKVRARIEGMPEIVWRKIIAERSGEVVD